MFVFTIKDIIGIIVAIIFLLCLIFMFAPVLIETIKEKIKNIFNKGSK